MSQNRPGPPGGGRGGVMYDPNASQQQGGSPQQQPAATPGPSPTPSGQQGNLGPYGSTSLSTPTQAPGSASPSAAGGGAGGAPKPFIDDVKAKIRAMAGSKGYLLDDAQLTAMAEKLWQSPTLQYYYNLTQGQSTGSVNYGLALANLDTQIQADILSPQNDPSVDPTIVIDYANAKQDIGAALTPAELNAVSNATMAANASIPNPFGQTTKVSGYDFGQKLPPDLAKYTGWDVHLGVDYGTTAGDRIVSPFAGTVTVTHDKYYGNLVTVTLDNGWKLSFGHVGQVSIQSGTRVNPGDLLAIAGANVGDAQGSVTIVTWQDPSGKYVNPHDVMDPIFSGTTFAAAGVPGAAGTGSPTVNSVLDREYPTIKSDFTRYFGTPPSPEDVYNILQHGSTPQQWTDYIRSMTSQINGMTIGQAFDLRQVADSVSMAELGHGATDGIVKDLFAQGITSQAGIKLWYDEHSPTDLDKPTYAAIAKANKPYTGNVLNDEGGFDPRIAKQQAALAQAHEKSGAAGGGGYTN